MSSLVIACGSCFWLSSSIFGGFVPKILKYISSKLSFFSSSFILLFVKFSICLSISLLASSNSFMSNFLSSLGSVTTSSVLTLLLVFSTFGSVSTCVVSSTGLVVTIVFVSSVLLISSFSSSSFLNGL